MLEHLVKIDQAAVRFWRYWRIIQVVPVNITTEVGLGNYLRKHPQPEGPANNPRLEIPLGVENPTILVGVFVDHRVLAPKKLF